MALAQFVEEKIDFSPNTCLNISLKSTFDPIKFRLFINYVQIQLKKKDKSCFLLLQQAPMCDRNQQDFEQIKSPRRNWQLNAPRVIYTDLQIDFFYGFNSR